MTTETEKELSNIVAFPSKDDEPRDQTNFLYEKADRPFCHHPLVRVNEKDREVRCRTCGAAVEPFDWMLSVAKGETQLADNVKALRKEEKDRRANIEKLIQIERNAKARIRRAQK
ncbi:hypothetical protein [Kluyvera ascorbata]|uniref:hypothetical protein n=1 Tax=Kluyvera ascorbata TaxID=51288 RepID=UPI002DBA6544|nr:hypothetical protein [Kluyvera ascorbata]MEB6390650.1 hypothetical protein [Kluyvera ascorbata]